MLRVAHVSVRPVLPTAVSHAALAPTTISQEAGIMSRQVRLLSFTTNIRKLAVKPNLLSGLCIVACLGNSAHAYGGGFFDLDRFLFDKMPQPIRRIDIPEPIHRGKGPGRIGFGRSGWYAHSPKQRPRELEIVRTVQRSTTKLNRSGQTGPRRPLGTYPQR